jgi:Uri superfamily endonuclease
MKVPYPSGAGSYVLILRLDEAAEIEVGRLGRLRFAAGYYLYVGSALAGLRARLARHARREKRFHWHIDYLLARATLEGVWYLEGTERMECAWAGALAAAPGIEPAVSRFGASDCRCQTHLFRCAAAATSDMLEAILASGGG